MDTPIFAALEEAIKIAGGVRELARRIDRAPSTIILWRKRGRIVKLADILAVHRACGGRVARSRLEGSAT